MNIYEDYKEYLEENKNFLEKIQTSPVMLCIQDVICVLDYIYKKQQDNAKLDSDMEEIFDIGFGYLTNVLSDFTVYYKEYFKENIDIFNHYSDLIIYNVLLDDLRSYLIGEEILDDERKKNFDEAENLIDDILSKNKPLSEEVINKITEDIEASTTSNPKYKPVYVVFAMIAEELNLI